MYRQKDIGCENDNDNDNENDSKNESDYHLDSRNESENHFHLLGTCDNGGLMANEIVKMRMKIILEIKNQK